MFNKINSIFDKMCEKIASRILKNNKLYNKLKKEAVINYLFTYKDKK